MNLLSLNSLLEATRHALFQHDFKQVADRLMDIADATGSTVAHEFIVRIHPYFHRVVYDHLWQHMTDEEREYSVVYMTSCLQ
jgi:hypothetical protein